MIKKPVVALCISMPLLAGMLFVQKGHYTFTYDTLTLPKNEKMGLLGTDYLYNFGHAYVGIGIYSAVSGHRGGFFTGGIDGGYTLPLYDNLALDAGLFVGGGGGGGAAQGGGLMLRGHAGLLYNIYGYKIGAGVSKVKFPNGQIDSNQLYVQLSIPLEEIHKKNNNSPMIINDIENFTKTHHLQAGWSNTYFSIFAEGYLIPSGTKNTAGDNLTSHIELMGFEYGEYITKHFMGYIQAAGAGGGGTSGYAQFLGGVGYKQPFNNYFGGYVKAALGAGGGGKVDTGGGLIHQESIGLYARLNNKLTLSTDIGYINAINGDFKATSLGVSLNYALKSLSIGDGYAPLSSYQSFGNYEVNMQFANQTYVQKNKTPLNLIGFELDRFLDKTTYIYGEALSAYSGGAGGYSVGLVGFGNKVQMGEKMDLFARLGIGVAGGGGVDTGGGFIYQPMVGVEYNPTKSFGIETSVGYVRAINGGLNAAVLNVGIAYKFKTLD